MQPDQFVPIGPLSNMKTGESDTGPSVLARSAYERYEREMAGFSENKFTNADLMRIKQEIKFQVE